MFVSDNKPTPTSVSRPTWRRCAFIVLLTMGVGTALAAWRPVWLAPPLLPYTPLVYLALLLAWLPVLIICALRRPSGKPRTLVLIVAIGLLVSLSWCALTGPRAGFSLLFGAADTVDCQEELLPEGWVRYTCTRSFFYETDTYVLEGRENCPFVRLVEFRVAVY
jgi:hypothetical protein